MEAINIKAFPKNKSQIDAVKAFLEVMKIKFEVTKNTESSLFESELQKSLAQVNLIKSGKLPKQSVKDFLNEL